MYRLTDTVKHLIIINVLMFIGTMAFKESELFYNWFALYFPQNELFKPWQIFTHMFMHGGLMHIFFNMFALWMFGIVVEQQMGARNVTLGKLLSMSHVHTVRTLLHLCTYVYTKGAECNYNM